MNPDRKALMHACRERASAAAQATHWERFAAFASYATANALDATTSGCEPKSMGAEARTTQGAA